MEHCVYRFFDADDALLYVGITNNIGSRLKDHGRTKDWWPQVARIEIGACGNRYEAVCAERRAITNEHPLHNIVHQVPVQPKVKVARPKARKPDGLPDGFRDPDAYSVTEAASILRIGRTKAWQLIKDGRLVAVRIDGRTVVPRTAVRSFLEQCPPTRGSTAA